MHILGYILTAYIILAFLVFLDSYDTNELRAIAEGLMWPWTLYQACKAYVKESK